MEALYAAEWGWIRGFQEGWRGPEGAWEEAWVRATKLGDPAWVSVSVGRPRLHVRPWAAGLLRLLPPPLPLCPRPLHQVPRRGHRERVRQRRPQMVSD